MTRGSCPGTVSCGRGPEADHSRHCFPFSRVKGKAKYFHYLRLCQTWTVQNRWKDLPVSGRGECSCVWNTHAGQVCGPRAQGAGSLTRPPPTWVSQGALQWTSGWGFRNCRFWMVGPFSHLCHDTRIIGLISDRRYPDLPSLLQRCGPCKASRCRGLSGGPWEDTFKS